mmetsp:Transcript_12591/g.29622  ORF Transcript_12591/g.29622 Transcript_12591/m.29622 type:complete len:206 (-) Transcript_12591:239-856(-)
MLRFFGTAVLAALIAVLVLEPPPGLSGGLCVSAARREVDVNGESMDVDEDDGYEDEDEYDDEDYDEDYDEDGEEVTHESVSPVSSKETYEKWENSEMTTAMWSIIDRGDTEALKTALEQDPNLVYIRSEDGRGSLFWAYEYEKYDMVKLLLDAGADPAAVDVNGNTPVGLMGKDERPVDFGGGAEEAEDAEDEYEDEYEDEGEDM